METAGNQHRPGLRPGTHDTGYLFVENILAGAGETVKFVGRLVEIENLAAEFPIDPFRFKLCLREFEVRPDLFGKRLETVHDGIERELGPAGLEFLPVAAGQFKMQELSNKLGVPVKGQKLFLFPGNRDAVEDLPEKALNLGKKPPGIQFALENQIAGLYAEMGIIAEPEPLGPGLRGESFEQITGLQRLGRTVLALARDADVLVPEIHDPVNEVPGNTNLLQVGKKRRLFGGGLRGIQLFFHVLEDKEARDLGPLHLREETFHIEIQEPLRVSGQGTHIRHELAVTILELFPVGDDAAHVAAGDLACDHRKAGFETIDEPVDDGLVLIHSLEGFVILPVKAGGLDTLGPDLLAVRLKDKKFRARQFPFSGKTVRKHAVTLRIGEEFQIFGIERIGGAFHEDGSDPVLRAQIFKEPLDPGLRVIVRVRVLDVEYEPGICRRRRFKDIVKAREVGRNIDLNESGFFLRNGNLDPRRRSGEGSLIQNEAQDRQTTCDAPESRPVFCRRHRLSPLKLKTFFVFCIILCKGNTANRIIQVLNKTNMEKFL
ncbi:MAG: hypothetical protein BWY49_01015 [Candidatus Omnitrophica bacterium ADurb.Bin314]|nr:MAG: hypothetical protein BWY49_01015 [Candidatus Omnitrophica bacterium ADurb.Bin314]